jgi:hypothetical protein
MKKLILLLAFIAPLFAQTVCVTQLNQVAAVGVSSTIDNRFSMCSTWVVTYNSTGFSAISIELDSANDVSGAPGAFALSAGTVLVGANPATATNCQATINCQFIIYGYSPWVRLNFSSKTGTGTLTALAASVPTSVVTTTSSGSSGCPGTVGTPCVVAGQDGAGNVLAFQLPTKTGLTNITASGNTQIIAASGSTVIRLGMLEFTPITSGNSVNFKLVYGTGVNCATGATDLTAVQSNVLAYSHDFTFPLNVPAGKALCFNLDAATPTNVSFEYSQY